MTTDLMAILMLAKTTPSRKSNTKQVNVHRGRHDRLGGAQSRGDTAEGERARRPVRIRRSARLTFVVHRVAERCGRAEDLLNTYTRYAVIETVKASCTATRTEVTLRQLPPVRVMSVNSKNHPFLSYCGHHQQQATRKNEHSTNRAKGYLQEQPIHYGVFNTHLNELLDALHGGKHCAALPRPLELRLLAVLIDLLVH